MESPRNDIAFIRTLHRSVVAGLFFVILITPQLPAQPTVADSIDTKAILERIVEIADASEWTDITLLRLSDRERRLLQERVPSIEWVYDSVAQEQDRNLLRRIGDVVLIDPVSEFAQVAVNAAYQAGTFEEFRHRVCAVYNEYDCARDFDPDLLSQAYAIAREIVELRKGGPPDILVAVSSTGEPIGLFGVDLSYRVGSTSMVRFGRGLAPALQVSDPVVRILSPEDEIYWYQGAPFRIPIVARVDEGGVISSNVGRVIKLEGEYYLVWDNPVVGSVSIDVRAQNSDGRVVADSKVLHVEQPELSEEARRLPILRATIGSRYRPSSQWESSGIPPEHYLTVVTFGKREVFRRRGVSFLIESLPDELYVSNESGPISATVYWLPGGDSTAAVPLLTTDRDVSPVVPHYTFPPVEAAYRAPVFNGQFEFTFLVDDKHRDIEWAGIGAMQLVGPDKFEGVESIDALCEECAAYGIGTPRVFRSEENEFEWRLYVEVVDRKKFDERSTEVNGRMFPIDLRLNGRGSLPGIATVDMVVRVGNE